VIKIPSVYVHSLVVVLFNNDPLVSANSSNPGPTGAHNNVGTKDSKHYKKRQEAKKY